MGGVLTILSGAATADSRLRTSAPEVGFFYYSGHGAADRPNGENYLIPTGAPVERASDLQLMGVRLASITTALASAGERWRALATLPLVAQRFCQLSEVLLAREDAANMT